jgi:hypothetical protein
MLVKQLFESKNNCKINIAELPIGMYVIEIKNDKDRSFQKFIIE